MTIQSLQCVGLISCLLLATTCTTQPNKWPFEAVPDGGGVNPDRSTQGRDGPVGGSGGTAAPGGNGLEPSTTCGTTCEAEKSDGCCPVGCTGASDPDCKAQCGNAVLERGEECDPPSSCPASCPNRGCTKFTLEGSAAECTAVCAEAGKETMCKNDDGCCPAGCTTADDTDCAIMCGNSTKEGNETCDPLASCPIACPAEACQLKKLVNAGTCTAECVNDRLQTTCTPGDGCCPAGCHTGNDSDCAAACDNGIKESGETCDPLASCPDACPANECQLRKLVNPGTCKAQCVNDRLQTACQAGDGCCPPGCNIANDNDCGVRCGDGVKDPSETCDPLATCPSQCPAMGCQLRELKNPGTCKAACENSRMQTTCAPNDGCCPGACHNNNDSDCDPRCGNGVVERDEKCEPAAECTRRQTACRSDRDTIREGRGNPAQCTFECAESPRRCGDADGQCPSNCQDDPDCKRANGSACENASQCLSNRCTDGRCCAETCGACEKCTGGGGTCQLPSGVRVCGSQCKSTNECCDACNGQCQTCNPAMNRCVGTSGGGCTANGQPGTCQNGSCQPNCRPGSQSCNTGNPCTTGLNRCPTGCQPTPVSDGTDCGNCRECQNGSCQPSCQGGQICEADRCVQACGREGSACCTNGSPCGEDLNCNTNSRCVKCGSVGAECCFVGDDPEPRCSQGRCRDDDRCGSCGREGQICCKGGECDSPFACNLGVCEVQ